MGWPSAKLGLVRSGWPISCSGTKTSLNVPSAYSPESYFLPRNNLCIPACHEKISGDFPFWTASLDIISEPSRTKYSEEPELYRFLARTKTCREIRIGPGDWLIPSKKMSFGRTAMYSSEGIFPLGRTYSSRPVTKKFRTVFRPERRHSTHFRTTAYRVQRRT